MNAKRLLLHKLIILWEGLRAPGPFQHNAGVGETSLALGIICLLVGKYRPGNTVCALYIQHTYAHTLKGRRECLCLKLAILL
jgi:hypothetical protein